MICASKGYKCIIVMPQLPLIQERYIICRQFGSQVHLTAPALGFAGLKAHAEQLIADNPDYILANQFYNEANPAAHYDFTGPEIWEQVNFMASRAHGLIVGGKNDILPFQKGCRASHSGTGDRSTAMILK